MSLLSSQPGFDPPAIVVVGMFDGMHLGHQMLIKALCSEASRLNMRPVVVTFSNHPSCVVGHRSSEQWIGDLPERLAILHSLGVEDVAVLDFTPELAQLTACEFVEHYLYPCLGMRALLLGYDTRFGNRTRDDFDKLPLLGARLGFQMLHHDALFQGQEPISSSRIRKALQAGDMSEVSRLLGRDYTISGEVVHGRHIGSSLGFPTANISLVRNAKIMPAQGVYKVILTAGGRSPLTGMANWGPQPTFSGTQPTLEVFLPDFQGSLYGETVEVSFIRKIRDIRRFSSREELITQLQNDQSQL